MIYPLKLYLRHRPNAMMLALSGLLNLAAWVWVAWYIRPQADPVFLHYNILFGVDFIGEWWRVFYLPLTGTLIIFANAVIGWFLFQRDKYIAYAFLGMAMLCQVFLLIGAALLVFLNI